MKPEAAPLHAPPPPKTAATGGWPLVTGNGGSLMEGQVDPARALRQQLACEALSR